MPRSDPAKRGAPLGKLYLVGYLPASRGELVPVLSGRRHTDATRRDLVRRLNLLGVPILADPPKGQP